jgi:hypothetical protein
MTNESAWSASAVDTLFDVKNPKKADRGRKPDPRAR